MESYKLSVKFFATDSASPAAERIAGIFQGWIQRQAIPDHLLIDVADYKHVAGGPGTLLVAHEGNFSLDRGAGGLGLLYQRKQPLDGPFTNRLRLTLRYALQACELLEQAPELEGRLHFATGTPLLQFHDRLLAPNTPETFAQVRAEAQPFLSRVYGAPVNLEHVGGPEELLGLRISAPRLPDIASLLHQLTI